MAKALPGSRESWGQGTVIIVLHSSQVFLGIQSLSVFIEIGDQLLGSGLRTLVGADDSCDIPGNFIPCFEICK